mmetsp:Transcript_17439/g.49859  ORF Transcript_17439/g.49859 Transcript_17439/m.49859 type:complete len:579 (+) Transcript_17439:497-2233(+)
MARRAERELKGNMADSLLLGRGLGRDRPRESRLKLGFERCGDIGRGAVLEQERAHEIKGLKTRTGGKGSDILERSGVGRHQEQLRLARRNALGGVAARVVCGELGIVGLAEVKWRARDADFGGNSVDDLLGNGRHGQRLGHLLILVLLARRHASPRRVGDRAVLYKVKKGDQAGEDVRVLDTIVVLLQLHRGVERTKRLEELATAHRHLEGVDVRLEVVRGELDDRPHNLAGVLERVLAQGLEKLGPGRVVILGEVAPALDRLVLLLLLLLGRSSSLLLFLLLALLFRLAGLGLGALALGSGHAREVWLGVILVGTEQGLLVMDAQVAEHRAVRSGGEEAVAAHALDQAQHTDVRPHRELAEAIGVEVELVLLKVVKVLLDALEELEGHAQVVLAHVGHSCFNLEPHALHVHEIATAVALVLGEERNDVLALLDAAGAELELGRLAVDPLVREIERTALLEDVRGGLESAGVLENAAFDVIEVHKSGAVLESLVDELESAILVSEHIPVLSKKVQHPKEHRRGLLLVAARQLRRLAQALEIPFHELPYSRNTRLAAALGRVRNSEALGKVGFGELPAA